MKYSVERLTIYIKNRLSINEVSGSLGDMGTLLPIILSLSKKKLININSALFFGGLFNIITGVIYDSPIPVQPMKSLASAALAGNLNSKSLITSGFLTSLIVFVLGITNLITIVSKIIPKYLISAIQMAQGLNFVVQGLTYIKNLNNWNTKDSYTTSIILGFFIIIKWLPWNDKSSNKILSYTAKVFDKFPIALILFIIGCIFASIDCKTNITYKVINPFIPAYQDIKPIDFQDGFFKGTIVQLPLTLLNSCLSVVELNNKLFINNQMSLRSLSSSVGIMNIVGVWFGSIPNCHGSGGLAGQYKFGARSGLAVIMLGLFKIIVSIFIGNITLNIITYFPNSILGLMLMVCGGELSARGADTLIEQPLIYSLVIGIMINTDLGSGFLVGMAYHLLHMIVEFINKKYLIVDQNENQNENQNEERSDAEPIQNNNRIEQFVTV